MAVTQPASSRPPGATRVSWPGGKAWLRLSPHQSEVCGLVFLVRELQTGSGGQDPGEDRRVCLASGRQGSLFTDEGGAPRASRRLFYVIINFRTVFFSCLFAHTIRICCY